LRAGDEEAWEEFKELSREMSATKQNLDAVENRHLGADPAYEDVLVRSTLAELRLDALELLTGRRAGQ
jgi:hypothetical protein